MSKQAYTHGGFLPDSSVRLLQRHRISIILSK